MRRPPQACFGHTASNTAVAGQPDGDLAEQRGDRVLTIILDPAGHATAAARRTARGVPPRLRSHELLLDASQELLTLGHSQAQGGQIREVVRSGDPHDLRAAFGARGLDAYQLHDPGHAVSAHRSTSRKVPSWTRTPNLAAVPQPGLTHERHVTGSDRTAARHPAFRWANTVLANVKNSLLATHRAVAAKHLPRYLGAFAWRFNRRFVLKTIYERLAIAAATTPPMPYRLLKLAEARW